MAGLKESDWKKFLKDKPTVDDQGLADALGKYAKTSGKDVDQQLESLEEVIEIADKAKKKNNKNTEVTSYLEDVLKEARKEWKGLDDDGDSLPPLGEKCDEFLAQAKKGQPRTFLLVCKGNRVKYLAVKKKPVKTSELAEAKKLGYKGDGYFGVITGEGMNLIFNLSMEDGYTTAPCKDKSLKNFLGQHADFECKPTFAIVATAPAIPFDAEDLSNPLIARFMSMETQVSNVLDVRPEAAAELTRTVSEIRLQLKDGDFTEAEPRVSALATRLQELLSGAPAKAPAKLGAPIPAAPSAAPAPATDPEMARFLIRFKALKPDIQAAIAVPDADPQISLKFNEIVEFATKKEFAQANALLFEVEQLLEQSAVANPAKKTGEQMARESVEKAQADKMIDRGFELDTETIVKLTKVTLDTREYAKFAEGFAKFVKDCDLGSDAQKIPVKIWAQLIKGLAKSGYIKGAIGHIEGDPSKFLLEEINKDSTGKPIREKLLAQAMAGLKPFVDHAEMYLDKVIQKTAEGSTWAFWSGTGAKEAALAENHGGIVLEGTVGAWFEEVWDFKALTGEAESLALWAAVSELYARKAAENFSKFKFIGFVGPGSTREQSVFNSIEQPTFVEVLTTKVQVPPPPIVWYVTDCEKDGDRWKWTTNKSKLMGSNRADALAEVKRRYESAPTATPTP